MKKDEQKLLFEVLIRHRGILEGQLDRSTGKIFDNTKEEIELTNRTLVSVTKIRSKCVP